MHQSYKLVLENSQLNDVSYHYNYQQVRRYIRAFDRYPRLFARVYFRSALAEIYGRQSEELVYEGRALSY